MTSLTKTSMPLDASSNSCTQAITSPASLPTPANSSVIHPLPTSTRPETNSSSTPVSTLSGKHSTCPPSSHLLPPKSTASTQPPKARSHMPDTYTPTPKRTILQFAHQSPTSGPQDLTPCAPRPRTSSAACAWSSLSSVTMFLVCSLHLLRLLLGLY